MSGRHTDPHSLTLMDPVGPPSGLTGRLRSLILDQVRQILPTVLTGPPEPDHKYSHIQ